MKECSQAGGLGGSPINIEAVHPKNQEISMGIWGIHGDLVGNHGKYWIPSGELTVCYGKTQHFSWENPRFLWPFSIAMLVHRRVGFVKK